MLLMLVQPTGEGHDEKGKWIQSSAHGAGNYRPERRPHTPIISIRLSSCTVRPVYGLWLIEELAEHGYRVSPGTLYPLLRSLEESELLKSYNELHEGKIRRYYKLTPNGRRQLKKAKGQLLELCKRL
jgi:DNA-binding PadR family transcriptional regulator